MSIATALSTASAKPAGKRPYFMTPEVERVMAIAMSIAQELAVARTRIDTLERILERKGIMSRADIEAFQPTPEDATERGLWMQEYIARVLRIVQQEAEHLATAPHTDLASEEVAAEVAKDEPPAAR
jgi:hypothetical protein